jgi:23S rRNA pseudouridine1911/1915/1917 synthase
VGSHRDVIELKPLSCRSDRPARLDAVLRRHYPEVSRRDLARAIAAGLVTVNGRRARKGASVGPGDHIAVEGLLAAPPLPHTDIPVLYADDSVLVMDKPAGIASVARRVGGHPSVAAYLLARLPALSRVGRSTLEGGLVHRLDTGTSGVLVGARSRLAWQHLRRQFAARTVLKEYLALVHGTLASPRSLEHRLGHHTTVRGRMGLAGGAGVRSRVWAARSRIQPVAARGGFTLVHIRLVTGVTHQIRAQLAAVGHPVVGDTLYGGAPAAGLTGRRFLLHATRIRFAHPGTGDPVNVRSPQPSDFRAALARLGFGARSRSGG